MIFHTHSLSQPEFPERIKLENPDVGPNPRHPLHVINLPPKHLTWFSLCIILGKTEKIVTQIFFCSLWFRSAIHGKEGNRGVATFRLTSRPSLSLIPLLGNIPIQPSPLPCLPLSYSSSRFQFKARDLPWPPTLSEYALNLDREEARSWKPFHFMQRESDFTL